MFTYRYHTITDVCTAALLPSKSYMMTLGSCMVSGTKHHYH